MNERDWADRFSRDVDSLLNEAGRTDPEPTPTEYRQALDLARTLAATDFSAESRVRQALRRRLLNRIDAREWWQLRKEYTMRTFFWKRHPAVTLAAVVLAAILVVTLAWPGTLTAVAEGIENFVQSLSLGPHTTVHQVSPDQAAARPQKPAPATPEVKQRSDGWTIRTAIGNFGGNVLPDHDATVHRFSTFDMAQAATPFSLRQPGYLPAGYVFREAMVAPGGSTFLFYNGPEGDIILVQWPVYDRVDKLSDDQVVTTVFMIGTLTDKPIEEVMLNGQPAGWVEGSGLMWEADGVSFTLGGASLSLDEALRIAESLE